MNRLQILLVGITLTLILISCGSDDKTSIEEGCEWNGNCSSKAPEGAYDCDGNSIVQCVKGRWEFVTGCSSCSCKGGCGTNVVECSFAFDVCDGKRFETCGPNATAQVTDKWECVPD